MQIAPANSRAPTLDGLVSRAGLGCCPAQLGYGLVGRELRKRPCWGRRRPQPAVAVPERRLDHAVQPHAPVLVEHRPDLAVHAALYAVVGRGDGAAGVQALVEVGEQGPLPAQLGEAAPRLPQPLVLVARPAVHDLALFEEPLVVGAPFGVPGQPLGRGVGRPDLEQAFGHRVQVDAGLGARPGRGAPLDLLEGVEGASLHPGLRPHGPPCPLEPAAVGHDDVGRRDASHEGRPRLRALAPGQVPADDVPLRARDQDDAAALEPDAVDVDDAVDLVAQRGGRPQGPELRGQAPEGSRGHSHLGLGPLRQEPIQEEGQHARLVAVTLRGGRAARRAAPSLGARLGLAVAFRLAPARRALHGSHGGIVHHFKRRVWRLRPAASSRKRTHFSADPLKPAVIFKTLVFWF